MAEIAPSRLTLAPSEPEARIGVTPLLDAKGAGALLNVPASWVLAEARADRIPHVRLGRYVRFDSAELQTWWHARRRGPWRSREAAAAMSPTTANSAV